MSKSASASSAAPDGRTYEQYLAERKLLIEGERAAGEGFDKTLLTLSAGAIALSVTFVEKLGSAGKFKPLLYSSWAILAVGLLFNIRAFLLLQNSYNRLLDMNDELYEKGTLINNPFRARVGDFNQYSFWAFVVGITLLLGFAGVNYQVSSKEPVAPERIVINVEDSKGIFSKILDGSMQRTAAGPNVVKLPHGNQTTVPNEQPPGTTQSVKASAQDGAEK